MTIDTPTKVSTTLEHRSNIPSNTISSSSTPQIPAAQSTSPSTQIDYTNTTKSQWSHVGYHRTTIAPESTFDPHAPSIKRDVLGMIIQYLQSEGLTLSSATVQDEANVHYMEHLHHRDALRRMTKAITDGDWDTASKLITKTFTKVQSQQAFLYAICKQEYLEFINRHEHQKAFTFLTTHLKPLEKIANMNQRGEFKDLCYLLTCKSIEEVEAFRAWEGVVLSRERLIEQLKAAFALDQHHQTLALSYLEDYELTNTTSRTHTPSTVMAENRLMTLLHQSVAYQMEFSRYHPKTTPKVTSLLHDFESEVLPNAVKCTYRGHAQNVKYVTFVGSDGEVLASGSSDKTIKLWPVEFSSTADLNTSDNTTPLFENQCTKWTAELRGHTSRIWYLKSNRSGDRLYSASGDGTVKVWDVFQATHERVYTSTEDEPQSAIQSSSIEQSMDAINPCRATLRPNISPSSFDWKTTGDLYSVDLHPLETHLVTGGYDQMVQLYDIATEANIKAFRGHVASVCDVTFNRHANLIVSGSKDGTVRLWDILSGLCVHTLRQTLGEVTSVTLASNGVTLLSGSRNNSNRLWDLRMLHVPRSKLNPPVKNTTSSHTNQIGSFHNPPLHPQSSFYSNYSSNNTNFVWSSKASEQKPIQRFKGHQNTAKNIVRASFGPREAFVLGGSEDGAVYVWDVATGKLLEKLAGHTGVIYNAQWHAKQMLMASSSHDGTVKTWWWQDQLHLSQ